MSERQYQIIILPDGPILTALAGDNLYNLLLEAGLVNSADAKGDCIRLEKGSISPAVDAEKEEAAFSQAELTEGWMLASQRLVVDDAEIMLYAATQTLAEAQVTERTEQLGHGYGLAFDLGSCTIAAGIVNLENRGIPLVTARSTSQLSVADSVSDRLAWARKEEGRLQQLTQMLRSDINRMAEDLAVRSGLQPQHITTVTVAGNVYMMTMLRGGMPADDLPFCKAAIFTAEELQLAYFESSTEVVFLPAVSTDIGGDMVGAAAAANLLFRKDQQQLTMLIDLSSEGEIIAAGYGRIVACSVPALPFEGAGIGCGMPAITGAITEVAIEGDAVLLRTVKDGRPSGLCGAGLISAVNCLLEQGLLDDEGRLRDAAHLPESVAKRLRTVATGREFVLSPKDKNFSEDVSLSQEDILQVQMAKGAVYAAARAVLAAFGVGEEEPAEILLAESFRANLNPRTVQALGMLPHIAPEQVISIGNAAWQGAYLALSSARVLQEMEQLAAQIEQLDLTVDKTYAEEFIKAMSF